MKNQVAIAAGLLAGLGLGLTASATGSSTLAQVTDFVAPLGTAFLNLLRMVIVPLVATTLFSGVAGLGDPRRIGRLGTATLLFFWGTTLISIAIGMAVMWAALPLAPANLPAAAGAEGAAKTPPLPGVTDFLLGLIPANPVKAAADSALLPLMVFAVLFGAAAATLGESERRRLTDLADATAGALIRIVHWILWLAPVGVFALAAPLTAHSGWAMVQSLGVFIAAVIIALFLFAAAVYFPAVRLGTRAGLAPFLRACLGPQAIAFSTTSSAAAIPAMLEAGERGLGLSRSVTSFVVPLGAALNRSGSALFQGAAIVFLARLYHVGLPYGAAAGAWLATFLVSLTVAAVPSASVVTLAPALSTVGIPLEGLGVLLGADRIPDMFRTAINVTGSMTAAAVMDAQLAGGAQRGAGNGAG